LRLLQEQKARFNLTALRDPSSIQSRHFGESLALLEALESTGAFGSPAIDIGSGAGFPGLPIKIARPDISLTVLEATAKKARFIELVVEALGLSAVTVIHGRAEELAHETAHRGVYALAMARAVAPLPALIELALPFLRIGGYLATPKGSAAAREVRAAENALNICGGEVATMRSLSTGGPGPTPTLVLVRKVAETPDAYPRRSGMPGKRPL